MAADDLESTALEEDLVIDPQDAAKKAMTPKTPAAGSMDEVRRVERIAYVAGFRVSSFLSMTLPSTATLEDRQG